MHLEKEQKGKSYKETELRQSEANRISKDRKQRKTKDKIKTIGRGSVKDKSNVNA